MERTRFLADSRDVLRHVVPDLLLVAARARRHEALACVLRLEREVDTFLRRTPAPRTADISAWVFTWVAAHGVDVDGDPRRRRVRLSRLRDAACRALDVDEAEVGRALVTGVFVLDDARDELVLLVSD